MTSVLSTAILVLSATLAITMQRGDASPGGATKSLAAEASVADQTCAALSSIDVSSNVGAPTTITAAADTTIYGKQYCQVNGYVAPQVQFQMELPANAWNGNFLFVGCGGFCGSIALSVVHAGDTDNYAVVAENEGHYGASEIDGQWAWNNLPAQIDWGYRAVHVVTLASKSIISAFYGTRPRFSYFDGCSDGGREGLSEAQRYPTDFNGIAAGDPNWLQNYLAAVAQGWVQKINYTSSGRQILPSSKLTILSTAAYQACAGPNGLITDPAHCKPDLKAYRCPGSTDTSQCLTAAQLEVAEKLYSGPVNRHGTSLYPGGGLPPGSEAGWAGLDVAVPGQASPAAASFATQYLEYLAFTVEPPLSYSLADFNLNTDLKLIAQKGAIYNADDPNLSAFRRAGGKLILYHGWSDPLISPYGTLYYYDEVTDVAGSYDGAQQFARLFMVPGMYHCGGGPGVSTFDALTPLTNWVETGQAPKSIIAEHLNSAGQPTLTLPLYPYPSYAQYDGRGDPTQASSYHEVIPKRPPDNDFCWIGWHGEPSAAHGNDSMRRCVPAPGSRV